MTQENQELENLDRILNGLPNVFIASLFRNGSSENFFSKNIEAITGYSPNEINGMPEKYHSLIIDDDNNTLKKDLANFEADSSKDTILLTYRITSKRNNIIWLHEILKVNREEDGQIQQSQSTVIDITVLKEKESEIEKSNKQLRDLNASKDKFISIVSHDLRAPFTTLLGFSEILLNEKDLTEDEQLEYLKYIYEASKTQLNLINCLLDWSRLQTGRIKVEPTRLNVKSAIATAITPLTGDAVRKNIDIKFDIPADFYMNADERLISQAIFNLTSNAIKFTPEGKNVHLNCQRFKEGMIEIVVRDEGMGIAEENQDKLFKIDQKFSLTGTNGEKGSGLGLTLMKEIVEKHGGNVWFYSQLNEGSEFHFTVPEAKNVVLIVESDNVIKSEYKKSIEHNLKNFEIRIVDNGYEAISLLKEILPTIIITNHDMPLMSGIQLVEALKKRDSSSLIPIIVVGTQINEDIRKSYSRLGIERIITKPIDQELLIDKMRECIF